MTGKEAFKIWAPAGARWVDWARPVAFAAMDDSDNPRPGSFTVPGVFYVAKPRDHVAIVIDTPGHSGVLEGIALAGMGFRPVPLYNGTNGQRGAMALVDNHALEHALQWGATELATITIPNQAPPVFLLDSNRMHRYQMNASIFDNSWDLYAQDMPSAEFFFRNGIDRILVRGETIQKDLAGILYPFQKKGMDIRWTDGYCEPKAVALRKPPRRHR